MDIWTWVSLGQQHLSQLGPVTWNKKKRSNLSERSSQHLSCHNICWVIWIFFPSKKRGINFFQPGRRHHHNHTWRILHRPLSSSSVTVRFGVRKLIFASRMDLGQKKKLFAYNSSPRLQLDGEEQLFFISFLLWHGPAPSSVIGRSPMCGWVWMAENDSGCSSSDNNYFYRDVWGVWGRPFLF